MAVPSARDVSVAIATGIGGHLTNGKRGKAYAYLLTLLVWPIAVFLIQVLSLVLGGSERSTSVGGSIVAILGMVAIWSLSALQALRDRDLATVQSLSRGRKLEFALLTIAAYTLAAYTVVSFVVVPYLPEQGQRIGFHLTSKPDVEGKPASKTISSGEGDLVLNGRVEQDGRPRPDSRFLLLFEGGIRSSEITTNSSGEFEFRLPPGTWRFAGPLVLGAESRDVSVTFDPQITTTEFQVRTSSPPRKLYMRIVIR